MIGGWDEAQNNIIKAGEKARAAAEADRAKAIDPLKSITPKLPKQDIAAPKIVTGIPQEQKKDIDLNSQLFLKGKTLPTDVVIPSEKTVTERNTKAGKLLQKGSNVVKSKIKNEASNFGNDLSSSLKDLKDGTMATLRDMVGGSARKEIDATYSYKEYSITNRHKDAISDIINGVTSGNLLDAGLNILKLHNNGTKFNFARAQDVNKDVYNFKYWYYTLEDNGLINKPNEVNIKTLELLDTIEDPTTLGYTLRIDDQVSPLFSKNINDFINLYKNNYPELTYAAAYLSEFKEDIMKIFMPPSTISGDNLKSLATYKKPHYILSIDGLDKLDNMFVQYDGDSSSHEALTLTLHEDVRMFTNRLSFLYKNLVYSYSMGKKLIPENLLRFNMYIKIADYRNFTTDIPFATDATERYSRVIYELKDCEFVFDDSVNPSSLSLGGFDGVNTGFANLKIRIKYKKVNRIFFSSLFGISEFLIGDAEFEPNMVKNKKLLDKSNFRSSEGTTEKRATTSNNIEVAPSLKERYNNLKNNGLLREDDNDSAVGRFMKKTTNNLTKKAMQPVDEGIKKVTNKLNNIDIIGKKAGIRTALGVVLDNKIAMKMGDKNKGTFGELGELPEHPNTPVKKSDGVIKTPVKKIFGKKGLFDSFTKPKPKHEIKIDEADLHIESKNVIVNPTGDLHEDSSKEVLNPIDDLHPSNDLSILSPLGDLHESIDSDATNPVDNLHLTVDSDILNPNADLHDSVNDSENIQLGDLHNNSGNENNIKFDDLHIKLGSEINMKSDDLHKAVESDIKEPNSTILEPSESTITMDNGRVNDNINNVITSPISDISKVVDSITTPNGNVNIKIDTNVEEPNDDKHPKTEHKINQSDKYSNLKDFLKNRKK